MFEKIIAYYYDDVVKHHNTILWYFVPIPIDIQSQRVRWGWPRSACDGRFKQDMYKLCEHVMGLWKRFSIAAVSSGDIVEECKSGADIYFAGVTVAGWLRYYTTSPRWCDAECAKEYGNPFTRKKDF